MRRHFHALLLTGAGLALAAVACAPHATTTAAFTVGSRLGTGAVHAAFIAVAATHTSIDALTAVLSPLWILTVTAAYTVTATWIVKQGPNRGAKCVRAVIAVQVATAAVLTVIVTAT
ncbi:hypothetical protein LO763_20160 [Glycomyces sp. A-F 0318]|uniref:hypothetical protein n=1 Tax=Glycomyces amatae TaxID=2881355 RepID=UPI001E5519C8|nr:hypothetical protein [Glycomyces amatae]MCD0445929.1 hypothetical protein [Glycomyces amatae]